MLRMKYPIGIQSFEQIIQNGYVYVSSDKGTIDGFKPEVLKS